MRPDRWPLVSITLGLLLLAAGTADGRELVTSGRDEDWSLVVRAELEFYGGLWLLCGLFPRWAWRVAVTAFVGIFFCDLMRDFAGYPTRHIWGRVATGSRRVLCGDLIVVLALLRWRRPGAGLPGSTPIRAGWLGRR